jgi:hypothetical protein
MQRRKKLFYFLNFSRKEENYVFEAWYTQITSRRQSVFTTRHFTNTACLWSKDTASAVLLINSGARKQDNVILTSQWGFINRIMISGSIPGNAVV